MIRIVPEIDIKIEPVNSRRVAFSMKMFGGTGKQFEL